MDIIYKDSSIIACLKPAGVLSEGEAADCLPLIISRHLSELGENNSDVFPVHRLDKETSGVMVFARTSLSAATLSQDIREGRFVKQYLAIVHGKPEKSFDTLTDLLFFDRAKVKSFIVAKERRGVKKAVLDYSLADTRQGLSLLNIRLHNTGSAFLSRTSYRRRQTLRCAKK